MKTIQWIPNILIHGFHKTVLFWSLRAGFVASFAFLRVMLQIAISTAYFYFIRVSVFFRASQYLGSVSPILELW